MQFPHRVVVEVKEVELVEGPVVNEVEVIEAMVLEMVVEVERVVKVMVRLEVVIFVVEVMVGGTTLMHHVFLLLCFSSPLTFTAHYFMTYH